MLRKKLRVVVIDDNPADAGIMRRNLDKISSFDVELTHYVDGHQGRDSVNRDGADCVFLDYQLGAVSGMEILTQIRQSGSDVPIVAVTGQGSESIVAEYFRRGAQEYLVKSDINPAVLESLIVGAIEKVDEERRRQEKEQELENFVSVVAHDLQQPLCAIKGNLDLIQDFFAEGLGEDGRKFVEAAVRMSARMSDMIEGLLAYSRVGRGQTPMEPVELDQCIAGAVASLDPTIKESGAEVRCSDLPTVWGDSMALGQLMQNLIGNALKYRSERPPVIEIGAQLEEGAWRCWVRDNGIGVEQKYQDEIFAPFMRVPGRERPKGSGIGLATCKKIVDQHQGRIWIESRLGEGSTFYFLLPPVKELENHDGVRRAKGRVLVLDGAPPIRNLLEQALTLQGYEVAGVASLKEATQRATHEPFDVVVVEMELPDGNGIEAIRTISGGQPAAKFIAVSEGGNGQGSEQLLRLAREEGAAAIFAKPFPLAEMVGKISELVKTPWDAKGEPPAGEPIGTGSVRQ